MPFVYFSRSGETTAATAAARERATALVLDSGRQVLFRTICQSSPPPLSAPQGIRIIVFRGTVLRESKFVPQKVLIFPPFHAFVAKAVAQLLHGSIKQYT